MRVSFIAHNPSLYGANRSLLELIKYLKSVNVSIHVVVPEAGQLFDELSGIDIPTTIIPIRNSMHFFPDHEGICIRAVRTVAFVVDALMSALRNLVSFPSLIKALKREQPDIIYSNSSIILIGWFAARHLKKPHIFHIRELAKIQYHLVPDWGYSIYNRIIHSSDAKIMISKVVKDHYFAADEKNVHTIYNGAMTAARFRELRNEAKEKHLSEKRSIFVIAGLLNATKRQDEAIRALALVREEYPDVILKIVGDNKGNKFKRFLMSLTNELDLEKNIVFTGYVNNPIPYYCEARATLVCSRFEAFGRVTVEAMAAGCPVIGHNSGGTAEIITHEQTGLLYSSDYHELADRMIQIIYAPDFAAQLAENAWKNAIERFSTETYGSKVHDVLSKLAP